MIKVLALSVLIVLSLFILETESKLSLCLYVDWHYMALVYISVSDLYTYYTYFL